MATKKATGTKTPNQGGTTHCKVRGCGRAPYARNLCQTHHRQFLKTGKTHTIRPYRPRSAETVKFAGLRLLPETVREIERIALQHHLSHGAAIALALDAWFAHQKKSKPSRRSG